MATLKKHSHLSSLFPLGARTRIKSADNIFKHWAKGHSVELCLQDEKDTEPVSQDTEDFPMQTHLGHCKQKCKLLLHVCAYWGRRSVGGGGGSASRNSGVLDLGFESWSSVFNTLKS